MNLFKVVVPSAIVLSVGLYLALPSGQAAGADADTSIPAVLQAGFKLYASGGGPEAAFDQWRHGGLLERETNAGLPRFRAMVSSIGNYKSHELIETRGISKSTRLIYLSVNFERGAVYARFVLYRTDRDWVVQHMDFNTRPEAIMPWLALAASE